MRTMTRNRLRSLITATAGAAAAVVTGGSAPVEEVLALRPELRTELAPAG
jgi:hypothetical protein